MYEYIVKPIVYLRINFIVNYSAKRKFRCGLNLVGKTLVYKSAGCCNSQEFEDNLFQKDTFRMRLEIDF